MFICGLSVSYDSTCCAVEKRRRNISPVPRQPELKRFYNSSMLFSPLRIVASVVGRASSSVNISLYADRMPLQVVSLSRIVDGEIKQHWISFTSDFTLSAANKQKLTCKNDGDFGMTVV